MIRLRHTPSRRSQHRVSGPRTPDAARTRSGRAAGTPTRPRSVPLVRASPVGHRRQRRAGRLGCRRGRRSASRCPRPPWRGGRSPARAETSRGRVDVEGSTDARWRHRTLPFTNSRSPFEALQRVLGRVPAVPAEVTGARVGVPEASLAPPDVRSLPISPRDRRERRGHDSDGADCRSAFWRSGSTRSPCRARSLPPDRRQR